MALDWPTVLELVSPAACVLAISWGGGKWTGKMEVSAEKLSKWQAAIERIPSLEQSCEFSRAECAALRIELAAIRESADSTRKAAVEGRTLARHLSEHDGDDK